MQEELQPKPTSIRVCTSRSCTVFGSHRIMEKISSETGLAPGEKNDEYDLDWCGCLGYCAQSPNVLVGESGYILTAEEGTVMEEIKKGGTPMPGETVSIDDAYDAYFDNDPLRDTLT